MDNEIAITDDISSMTKKTETVKTGLGARLRKARETINLTEKEAAARLYLNVNIISIIENETFTDGPPVTFMRGYLRSYARMLNFPEPEIKAAVDELEISIPPTRPFAPILHATPINRSDRYVSWITYLIVLTLIVLVTLWWNSHSKYVIADVPTTPGQLNQPFINASDESDTTKPLPEEKIATESTDPSSIVSTVSPVVTNLTPTTAAPEPTTTILPSTITPSVAAQAHPEATTTTKTTAQLQNSPPGVQPLAKPAIIIPTVPLNVMQPTNLQPQAALAQDNTPANNTPPAAKPKKQNHKSAISNMALALPEPG